MTFSALDSALLGPLFATPAMRTAFSDLALICAMLDAEAALARAQAELGLVPDGLAEAIAAIRPQDLDINALGEVTALAGVPTIPFVKALQSRIPKELEPHVHRGATSQDILDTAMALRARQGFHALLADLDATLTGLALLAEAHSRTPCVGRTYGQHAAPITFGYKAAIWCLGVAECAEELPGIRRQLLTVSLGGPVGTLAALGSHGPVVAESFARHLGLGASPAAWHTRRARVAEAGMWLTRLIGALAKIATDVAHLASTEVGEVAEPHLPGRGGSSAMPHKRNPVSSTVILAAHAAAAGLSGTLAGTMAAAHERPAGLWHAEWHVLPQLFGLASGALREAALLAGGLTVDGGRMQENLDFTRGLIFADAAASQLSFHLGRDLAHAAVERAAAETRAGPSTLIEALRKDQALAETVKADLQQAFDVAPAVEAAALWTGRALGCVTDIRTTLAAAERRTDAAHHD